MIFYRLIKPLWAKEKLPNQKPNPDFKEIIRGPSTIEGVDFSKDFLEEKNKAGYNLYYFPNRPSTNVYTKEKFALSGKDIHVFSYIFLDMDLKDKVYESKEAFLKVLKDFNFTPSLTVDSGNGIHAYWKISDLTLEIYLKLQLCLIKKFDTDKSVFSVLQLMRVPESLNTKRYKDYSRSSIVKDLSNKKVYTLFDIPEELDKILGPTELAKVQEHLDKLSGKYEVSLIDVDVNLLPERFVKLMNKTAKLKEMFTDPRSVGKDRSAVDLMLTSELYRLKFDINDALIIISNTQKALEKGASRMAYASLTVAKVYKNRATHRVTSVKDYMRNKKSDILEPKVNGPFYMDSDVLGSPWRKKEMLGLIAGSGLGKCHGKDTEILLYTGEIKKVQDIKVGELLMGNDSSPRTVLNTVTGKEELFKVTLNKGDSYVVNKSHILSLVYSNSEKRYGVTKGHILNISVEEYLKKSKKFKSLFKAYKTGVDFSKKQELTIDPYFLGIWLGDGSANAPEVTTMDLEIKKAIKQQAEEHNLFTKEVNGKATRFSLIRKQGEKTNVLRQKLDKLDLICNKHIPFAYKTASRKDRLSVLAGLIDSDGHNSNNCVEIIQKSSILIKDIEFLARSLGFATTTREVRNECVSNRVWGTYYRMFIYGNLDPIPTKLIRKQFTTRKQIKNHLIESFTVESLGLGDYYGFSLDGNHLYVLGNFSVTHNTAVALNIVKDIIKNNPHNDEVYVFFSLEMSKDQVIKRWLDLTNNDLALAEKFFVIDRVNEKNLPINIGLQEIYEYSQEVTQVTGKKIGAIILDHFHIISTHIDARKSPNFGIDSEQNTGRGDIRNLSLNGLATQLKALTQTLNTFCILLSQTTKGKGIGDTPLAKDAAYGVSQFEWIVDRIITIWQPLMRVQNKCATKFLAFQYAKIREKTIKDEIRELEPKVLVYSLQDGSIRVPCVSEYQNFEALLPEAEEARKALLKNEGIEYSIQIDLDSVKRALLN